MGYDISDYEAVHEPYGTVEDLDELIEVRKNDLTRVISWTSEHLRVYAVPT